VRIEYPPDLLSDLFALLDNGLQLSTSRGETVSLAVPVGPSQREKDLQHGRVVDPWPMARSRWQWGLR
jgi:hypothetical protein